MLRSMTIPSYWVGGNFLFIPIDFAQVVQVYDKEKVHKFYHLITFFFTARVVYTDLAAII